MAATPNWAVWGVFHWPRKDNNSKCNHAWNWNEPVQISIHSQQIQIHSRDKSKRSPVTAPTAEDFMVSLLGKEGRGLRNGGCWRDQRRKAWNHDTHGRDVITMLFLGLKTKNTVAIKIWDNRKNSFRHHALNCKKYEYQHLSENMIWLDPKRSETMGQAPVTGGAARVKLGKAERSRRLGAHSWVG